MSEPLILQSKLLMPRFAAVHVPRPHLVRMFLDSLSARLTVLTAPPGYGKTTLVVEAVSALDCPVVWYQLDSNDNAPTTFLAYMVEGLYRQLPAIGRRIQDLLAASGPHPADRALILILNELVENPNQRWVFVLDDYHFINNPAVHTLVTSMLENQPGAMRVVLVSRNHPPLLPLARWRARGWLAEIRDAQLRFSTEEVMDWLAERAASLPRPLVERLVEKTEGWGAGLQLSMTLLAEAKAEPKTLLSRLNGQHPYIFNYLMEEVFERQSQAIQDFLLRSAVLSQLNADLCRAVLDIDTPLPLLETLEQENLFLVRLDEGWYRYHHLFREFLLNRLERQSPGTMRHLQLTAAAYYTTNHNPQTAVQYYLMAKANPEAARSLLQFAAAFLAQGRLDVLDTYLHQLEPLTDYPDLLLIDGQIHRYFGQLSVATEALEQVLRFGGELACTALTELASISRSRGDYRHARDLATEAVTCSEHSALAIRAFALMELAKCEGFLEGMDRGRALAEEAVIEMRRAGMDIAVHDQARLLRSLGQICWWHGDVVMAVVHCETALNALPDKESPLAAEILITLATPCLYRHQYESALRYAEQSVAIAERLQLRELLPTTYAVLGNILTRLHEHKRAEAYLRQAIELASTIGAANYDQVMAGGYLAYNLMAQGRADEARQVAETALWSHEGRAIVYEVYVCRSVLADIYVDTKQAKLAATIFEQLIEIGEQRQYKIPLAMAYFGLAAILLTEHASPEGKGHAQRSLDLISPSQAWELYVDQGPRALVVCGAIAADNPGSVFLARVHAALGTEKHDIVQLAPVRPSPIRVQTLGSLRVFREGQEIDPRLWISAKARDLLAFCITFRSECLPLDRILDALWNADSGHGHAAFHTALYRLRQALRVTSDARKFLVAANGDYHLDVAQFEIDVDHFENLIRQVAKFPTEPAIPDIEAAIALYHGPYLNNLYYDWVLPERQRLNDLYVQTLRMLAQNYFKAARWQEALAVNRQALTIEPLDEKLHSDAMCCLQKLGDRGGLTKQYTTLCELLRQELKVEPLAETQALYLRLSKCFRG